MNPRSPETAEIVVEGPDRFVEHAEIPISFTVTGRVDVPALWGSRGQTVAVSTCAPYEKDYDAVPAERPSAYADRFDVSAWRVVAAYSNGARIGGAVIARGSKEFPLLEGRDDVAQIADLRVAPGFRGMGVGTLLVEAAAACAKAEGCHRLRVETQDSNVAACKFYSASGFTVFAVEADAYGPESDEVMIGWERHL